MALELLSHLLDRDMPVEITRIKTRQSDNRLVSEYFSQTHMLMMFSDRIDCSTRIACFIYTRKTFFSLLLMFTECGNSVADNLLR